MNTFFQHLSDPEYMHVLLNPLPVYGLSIAVLGLLLSLIARNRRAVLVALALIFVSGFSAWPTYHYGESAYDRVKAMSDPAGERWLDEHMARAEKLIAAFYVVAGLALVAMLAPIKWPHSSTALSLITLAATAATLGIGFWIAYAGGHIRHKEFRFQPPPVAKSDEHTHTHGNGEGAPDHGSMPGMEAGKGGNSKKEQPMPHDAAEQPAAPAQEELEASRMQLEASRLQLEASRKQLEAVDAAKAKTGSPSPQQIQSPHPEDRHEHEPKP